eukprot:m.95352 g.95352  ORF g.95352 m.95352 type:complete len:1037 (+) comp16590_c0_seq1:246-3356(+)
MSLLDAGRAARRFNTLWSKWQAVREDQFDGVDALIFARGKDDEELVYCKSKSLQQWLFGYELPEVVIAVCKDEIVCLGSKKKVEFLSPLSKHSEKDGLPKVTLLTRNKADGDKENLEKLVEFIKGSHNGNKIGVFSKVHEAMEGPFGESVAAATKMFVKVNVSGPVGALVAVNSDSEVNVITNAARLSSAILEKKLKKRILDVVDVEGKVSHVALSEETENYMTNPTGENAKPADKLGLEKGQLESCYQPIIQSGGEYNLKPSAQSNSSKLTWPGAIMCALGIRYQNYCSNVARTYLVEPTKDQKKAYELLLQVQTAVIDAMVVGKPIADAYKAAHDLVQSTRPELASKLTKNMGFGLTIDFREGALLLSPKCKLNFEHNMVFNVAVGFDKLTTDRGDSGDKEVYSLLIADTVRIAKDSAAQVLTTTKKSYDDISFEFKSEDDEDEEDAVPDKEREKLLEKVSAGRRARDTEEAFEAESKQEERKRQFDDLEKKINDEASRRLLKQSNDETEAIRKKGSVQCYKERSQMSGEDCRKLRIFVDKRREAVVLPMFGMPVPFHISVIKNCAKIDEDEHNAILRVNFDVPGVTLKPEYKARGEGHVYLKEMTYRSSQVAGLSNAHRLIKDLLKRYRTNIADQKELENYVEQDDLILNKKGIATPALQNMYVRPSAEKRRVQGTLEAHKNGFLYVSRKGEKIKILYNNIRHAFFQPPDGDIVIMLHFTLKNGLMIGKKQQKDIQFYVEVGEVSTDLSKRSAAHDREELEAEQRERVMRSKLKKQFRSFMDRVMNHIADMNSGNYPSWEFEEPHKDLGFFGVPGKEAAFCAPTTNCLVSLTVQPPFVLTLEDVERVHFERVDFALRNFDMVFIPKDYTKPVVDIKSIEMKALEGIKDWLVQCELIHTERSDNLNWKKVMKTIVEDPEEFIENGGWDFLKPEESEEIDEDDGEQSEEYAPSEDDDEDDDDDDDSESDYSVDESSGSEESLDSDESEGMDWDELESKAKNDDRHAAQREHHENIKRRHEDRRGDSGRNSKRARR